MSLFDLAQALESSRLSLAMRNSDYSFPLLNGIHLLGLLVAAGTIVFWDLRLLGVGLRQVPVSQVGRSLLPWTWSGFGVMFLSGALMVVMEAARLYADVYFRLKVVFLILAGLNVLVFHATVYRKVASWDSAASAPLQARFAGGLSLLLWFSILAMGRAIGYSLDYSA